jgi:hypothetical protein
VYVLNILISWLAVVLLWAATASAIPVPATLDVPPTVAQADLIVVGHKVETNNGTFISADRVLKGVLPTDSKQVSLRLTGSNIINDPTYGMFFLKGGNHGIYSNVDPYYPALTASPNAAPNVSASALEKVAAELVAVLTEAPETFTNPPDGIIRLPAGTPIEQAQWVYFDAANALATIPYGISKPYLDAAVQSGGALTKMWAVACKLQMGDSSNLNSIADALINPRPDWAITIGRVSYAMKKGNTRSPMLISVLSKLLKSSDVRIRTAAAYNLRDIGTSAVIKPLATTALNDTDEMVRYYAVSGLEKASGTGMPAVSEFKANEAAYIEKWRAADANEE